MTNSAKTSFLGRKAAWLVGQTIFLNRMTEKEANLLEEFSLTFEQEGEPRIAGLIVGWLLICNPPEQSFNDLVEELEVSKASISNMTRLLENKGIIEKVRKHGERHIYFRIKPRAWESILKRHLEVTKKLRDVAAKGLKMMEEDPDARTSSLREMKHFFDFSIETLPKLIEDYKEKRDKDGQ